MPGEEREQKRVEPISGSEPRRQVEAYSVGEGDEETAVAKAKFDKAVEIADPSKVELRQKERVASEVAITEVAKRESLVDLARKTAETPKAPPTIAEIDGQSTRIRKDIERPRALLLAVGDVPVDPKTVSQVFSGANMHLEHMDRALRDVSKMVTGVEAGTLVDQEKPPLVRFLKYLTESDKRLSTAVDEISALDKSKEKLTPQQLMSVQIKLNFIQQELEFFSNALGKGLDALKTIMNV
jgi:hypothetical protein